MKSKIGTLFIIVLSCIITLNAQQPSTFDIKVEDLLSRMTLDEKIGQMNQYNGFWDVTGPPPTSEHAKDKYEHLKAGLVGSMINIKGVKDVKKIQKIAVEETRLGIPLIFGFDVIHGYKTISPIPLGEAASWDLEAIRKSAEIAAAEASAVGINWTFAPMVDITRDPRWGRVMEGAGEDPFLGSKIATARVLGFQGSNLSETNTIVACAKHFAGYGYAEAGKDYNTVDIGTSTLYNTILPPFKACVDAGVGTFMNSFNDLNGIPATGNSFLQRDILKGRWKFKGFVVSDWGSVSEMIDHRFAYDLKDAASLAVNAGCDMDMESYAFIAHLKSLVLSGEVSMDIIDDAVSRILRIKYQLGLFDDPYKYCDEKREKEVVGHPDFVQGVLDLAKKSMVLLKNEGQILPLPKQGKKIAIIGALANDKNSLLGNWRLAAEDHSAISVLEGMEKYTGNTLLFSKGPEFVTEKQTFGDELIINESDTTGLSDAVKTAASADVIVMVLGEHGFQSGEGRSRANPNLPGLQQQLLETIYQVNKNIVVVLTCGRPLIIPWLEEHIPAIVIAWQPGSQGGNAIAEVLYGDYNPSGKLPMTFPRSVGQIPITYNYKSTGRPGPKSQVFWSHYTDESNSPLYPFGFGLSYTRFEYKDVIIEKKGNSNIHISVNVFNVGDYDGEEVVQLYLTDKVASITRPVKELKGFSKVKIAKGEHQKISFTLTDEELGFFDANGNFIVEPGQFEVQIGGNSEIGIRGVFTVE